MCKKYFMLASCFCLMFLGCSKKEDGKVSEKKQQAASEHESTPENQQAVQQWQCKDLGSNLEKCHLFTCSDPSPLGPAMTFTVTGEKDGVCNMTQDIEIDEGQRQPTLTCNFNKTDAERAAKYYNAYFNSSGDISASFSGSVIGGDSSYKETIDSKEVDNPLADFLKLGVCSVPGMPAQNLPVMTTYNSDGTSTTQTLEKGSDGVYRPLASSPSAVQNLPQ